MLRAASRKKEEKKREKESFRSQFTVLIYILPDGLPKLESSSVVRFFSEANAVEFPLVDIPTSSSRK
jgi:hypothetical protein